MVGNWRWNAAIGGLGFLITFAASVGHNVWQTTLIRCGSGFVILFLATFVFRWMIGYLVAGTGATSQMEGKPEEDSPSHLGQAIDLRTPDTDGQGNAEAGRLDEEQDMAAGNQFTPLTPPVLMSKQKLEPDALAKAVRHLSEE